MNYGNIYKKCTNILHIDKSQAMWIDTGTIYTKGKTTHPAMWIDIGGSFLHINITIIIIIIIIFTPKLI